MPISIDCTLRSLLSSPHSRGKLPNLREPCLTQYSTCTRRLLMSTTRDDHPEQGVGSGATVDAPPASHAPHVLRNLWRRARHFLIVTGPAITAVALVLALFQSLLAWWGAGDVRQIADSVSTQYV